MIIGTYCKSFTFFQKLFPKNPLFRGGFKLQMALYVVYRCSMLLTVKYRGYARRLHFSENPWYQQPMIVETADQYSIRMRPGFFRIRRALE